MEDVRLNKYVEQYTKRPVGRPGRKPIMKYISFQYRGGSWDKERRVVAKIEHHTVKQNGKGGDPSLHNNKGGKCV